MQRTDLAAKREIIHQAFELMCTAKTLTELYEDNLKFVSKYVHATSRGHEAIQIATGQLLKPCDFLSPYYRDDAMVLSIGMTPYDLMLQLLAKRDDPFSGGRTYYSHPSLRDDDKVKITHQSSATGMQAIPSTGIALGIQYREQMEMTESFNGESPVVVCSLGDAAVTEGEVSEAFQMAALRQLPIIYLIQDNGWDISAKKEETRAMDAYDYIGGFTGVRRVRVDGTDFMACHETMKNVIDQVRHDRKPYLVHASVPLLNHHTSGVRMEWYRDDLEEARARDPYPQLRAFLQREYDISDSQIEDIENKVQERVKTDFDRARKAEDPRPSDLYDHDFAPTSITEEKGERSPATREPAVMVDSALFAVRELMEKHPECLLYGQDVGGRLGGVFREAATLAAQFGDHRVFNTPIQEAFIIGSTVGMSAVGLKPIVEVQFADYIWPGLNQLFTEVSRSYFLSNGKWPVSMVLRVPIGAYGSGGPYHSSSVESIVANIRGIKIVYPSTGADLKGLMKAAYYDPNPVVIFEHKGLYWSKVPGTDAAMTIEPDEDYVIPIGKGRIALAAEPSEDQSSMAVVAYGMGVHWALNAANTFPERVEIIDLRSLYPLDMDLVYEKTKKHHRLLVITEESVNGTLAQSIAARVQENCFEELDAPVRTIGSENMPAIPLNETLEKTMVLDVKRVTAAMEQLLAY